MLSEPISESDPTVALGEGIGRELSPGPGRLGLETFLLRSLTYVLSVPASVALARSLGPSGRGSYQLAVNTSLVVLTVVLLGVPQAIFRAWGEKPPGELLASARLAAIVLAPAGFAVCMAAWALGHHGVFESVPVWAFVLVAASIAPQIHAGALIVALQSAQRSRKVNTAMAIAGLTQSFVILGLAVAGRLTVVSTAVTYVMSLALQWFLLLRAVRRVAVPTSRAPWRDGMALVRSGLVFQGFIVAQFLLLRLDVVLLGAISGVREVGIYTVAVLLAELVWLLTDALAQVSVQETASADPASGIEFGLRATRMAIVLSTGGAIAVAAGAPFIVTRLFGAEFSDAASATAALLPGIIAMAIWRATAPAIVKFASPVTQPLLAGTALAINVVCNLLLDARFGAIGASAASSISYVAGAVLAVGWLLRRSGAGVRSVVPGPGEFRSIWRALPVNR